MSGFVSCLVSRFNPFNIAARWGRSVGEWISSIANTSGTKEWNAQEFKPILVPSRIFSQSLSPRARTVAPDPRIKKSLDFFSPRFWSVLESNSMPTLCWRTALSSALMWLICESTFAVARRLIPLTIGVKGSTLRFLEEIMSRGGLDLPSLSTKSILISPRFFAKSPLFAFGIRR